MRLVLIDDRIEEYENIITSFTLNTDAIVFSYKNDTIEDIQSRILNSYDSVAIIQHKIESRTYRFVDAMPDAILYDLEKDDAGLYSWEPYTAFLEWLVKERGVQFVDLLACNLWADVNWKYAITSIRNLYDVYIRASIDITGDGGNFILESDGIDTIGIYFTEDIQKYKHSFFLSQDPTAVTAFISWYEHNAVLFKQSQSATVNPLYGKYAYPYTGEPLLENIHTIVQCAGSTSVIYTDTSMNVLSGGFVGPTESVQSLLVNVMKVVGNGYWNSALRYDGVVVSWGEYNSYNILTPSNSIVSWYEVQYQLTDIIDIIAFNNSFIALKRDRTIVGWGLKSELPWFNGVSTALFTSIIKLIFNGQGAILERSVNGVSKFILLRTNALTYTGNNTQNVFPIIEFIRTSDPNTCYLLLEKPNKDLIITNFSGSIIVYNVPTNVYVLRYITGISSGIVFVVFSNFSVIKIVNNNYTLFKNVCDITVNNARFAMLYTDGYLKEYNDSSNVPRSVYACPDVASLVSTGNTIGVLYLDGTFSFTGTLNGQSTTSMNSICIQHTILYILMTTNIRKVWGFYNSYEFIKTDGSVLRVFNDLTYTYTPAPSPIGGLSRDVYIIPGVTYGIPVEFTITAPVVLPTYIYQDTLVTISYTVGYTTGCAIYGRLYKLYAGGVKLGRYVPTEDTFTYTFSNLIVPIRGEVVFTIVDCTYPTRRTVATFTKTVLLPKSTPFVRATQMIGNRILIPNLTNDQTYTVFIKTYTANGNSEAYSTIKVKPIRLDFAPITLSSNNRLDITGLINDQTYTIFIRSFGANATGLAYSKIAITPRAAPSYTFYDATVLSNNRILIPNLVNGQPYTILLKSYNAIGESYEYASIQGTPSNTEYSRITSLDNNQLILTGLINDQTYTIFIRSYNTNGPSPDVVKVLVKPFKLDFFNPSSSRMIESPSNTTSDNGVVERSFRSIGQDNRIVIPDLINGQRYTILLKSYNSVGESLTYAYATGTPLDLMFQPVTELDSNRFFISGLSNGQTYTVFVKSYNALGNSYTYSKQLVIPCRVPDIPTLLNITPLNRSIRVDFSPPAFDGGRPITDYLYSVDGGNTYEYMGNLISPYTVTGLINGKSYSVALKAVNTRGFSEESNILTTVLYNSPRKPTITRTISLDSSVQIFFQPFSNSEVASITDYLYSVNGGNTFTSMNTVESPYTITGLTNGNTYYISISAVSIGGNSVPSSMKTVIPYSVPDAPSITTIITLEDAFVVNFGSPFNGGNAITDYLYSVNGGNTYSYMGTTTSPYVIDNSHGEPLVRGGYYTIVLKAVNSRGSSLPSIPRTVVLYTYPGKPTLFLTPLNRGLRLTFETSYDGGNAVTNYLYSVNGGNTYSSMNTAISPFLLTGLTNFVSYTVSIKAVNARGNSVASDEVTAVPVPIPDTPTITKLVSLNNSIRVEFEPSIFDVESGVQITDYLYTIDGGNSYAYMGITQSPYTISNLVNGTTYYINIRASNYGGNSVATSTYAVVPYTIPDTPTINSLTPLYQSIRLDFTAPLSTGGNAITDYRYSLNGGASYISANTTTSPYIIQNINNSTTYSISLVAVNYAGNSIPTPSQSITPYTLPNSPIITAIDPLKGKANLFFNAPEYDGGTPIITYLLSINNGVSYESIGTPTMPYLIDNLVNGVEYLVSVIAVNALGNSTPTPPFSVIPYTVPGIPIINSIVPLSQAMDISFSQPIVNGGSPIISYSYSLNGTDYISMGVTPSTYRVSGLENGTSYPVTVIATNILGNSLPTDPIIVTPFTIPNPPVIHAVIANSESVDVSFSAPVFNGGNTITDYLYSINGINGNYVSSGLTVPPDLYRISNLVNGTSYTIAIKAVNYRGVSTASNAIITIPYTIPEPPIIRELISYNSAFDISFSASVFNGGNAIVDYAYALNDPFGPYISMGSTNALYRVSNLTNGSTYTVYLKAVNARGYSNVSSSASTIPYTIPDAPTITQLVANDGSIDVGFTGSPYDGGNAVTDYAYSLNGALPYISMNTNDPSTIYRIRDLSNAVPYTVTLKASNYRGYSVASNSVTTTPYRVPDAPIIYELISLPNAIDISFSQPFNGGNTITNYEYSFDRNTFISMNQSTNRQYTVSGLTDGQLYTIYLRAINNRGSSTISDPKTQRPITPASAPVITQTEIFETSVTVYFVVAPSVLPITDFLYSINGSTYISLNRNYNAPFTITGLVSGQSYPITMKSAIFQVLSVPSTPLVVIPYTIPNPPAINALIPNDSSIDVSFSAPAFNGGNTITDYLYSINSVDYFSMNLATATSLYRISGLTNGTSYTVYVKAVNARGISNASASKTTIPYTVPDAPIITSLIPLPASIDVLFSAPAFNGGNAITNYLYSINGTTYTYMNQAINTTYRITGLTDGQSYTVYLKAVNARGNSAVSNQLSTIPYRIPDPPTYQLIPLNQAVDIVYNAPAFNGGNAITQYVYSLNGGTYTYMNNVPGTYTVTGLLNSNLYSFRLQAINYRGNSVPTAIQSIIPYTVPDAPVIQSLVPLNASVSLNFIAPSFNGGNTLTNYIFSIDGGLTYSSMNTLVSPYLIVGLNNGTEYNVTMCAVNIRGNSEPAPVQSVIPFTIPDTPIVNAVIPLISSVEVDFDPPLWNGGNAITNYIYSVDGGLTYSSMNTLISPYLIVGLNNGDEYNVVICAVNSRGNSAPTTSQRVVPYNVPDTPIIQQLIPLNASIEVVLSPTFNGGNAITNYAYSLDGWNTVSYFYRATAPLVITGLDNSNTYTVSVTAINARGNSNVSLSSSAIPFTIPDAPTLTRVKPGTNTLEISFLTPSFNGGNTITDYAYSLDNGITYTSMGASPILPYIVYGLTNFQTYYVNVVAINNRGNSIASNTIVATPSLVPDAPIITGLVPQIRAIDVLFDPPSFNGGNPIINYLYSINNSDYISMNQSTAGTYTITGLTNGTVYTVSLKSENDVGISTAKSNYAYAIPFDVPDPPTITQIVPSDQAVSVYYTAPAWNGGKNIIGYKYSISETAGNVFAPLVSVSVPYPDPFTISNLTNGTIYYVSIVAVNLRGDSVLSNSVIAIPCTVPDSPILNAVVPINRAITLRFSPPAWNGGNTVIDYTYVLNGNTSTDYFTSSPYTITGLINGESYEVGLYARNSVGLSLLPTMEYFVIPYTVPDKPEIVSYTASGSNVRLTFVGFNGGRNPFLIRYSINGSSFLYSAFPLNNTAEITQLQNGSLYSIRIISVNIAGDSIPSDPFIVATIPTPPVINTLVPGRLSLIANITPGRDEGNTVTSYEYTHSYISNGQTITVSGSVAVSSLTDPNVVTIPNLLYAKLYNVYLRAVNSSGKSEPSNTVSGIPADVPEKPTIVRFVKGNGEITIYFSFGDPRGYPVTECAYVLYQYNQETQTETSTETILNTINPFFVITNVVNGVNYGVAVKAKNAVGYSDLSDRITATPFTVPSPAIITEIVAINNSVRVNFAYGDNGGSDIINALVSVEGPSSPYQTFSALGPNVFAFFLENLLNENDYTLKIKLVNIAGISREATSVFRPKNQEVYKELVKRNSNLNPSSLQLSKSQLYALTVRINKGNTRYI